MVYKNFRINTAARVLVILGCGSVLIYCLLLTDWLFTPIAAGLVLLLAVLNLISYVERTNNDMANFLLSIHQGAFSEKYSFGIQGKSFERLGKAFNLIISEFKKVSVEKESHYQYLQTLNESIGAGIISYKPDGTVQLFNQAAKNILQRPGLTNINQIKLLNPNLFKLIEGMKSGERVLTQHLINNHASSLSIDQKEFKLGNEYYKVLLIQNIQNELDTNEIQAWQKLTRVLTHEIMNSVTPIASLTEAVNQLLNNEVTRQKDIQHLDDEALEDVYGSLETIEKRSKGLLKFVQAYKDFSKDPEAKMEKVNLVSLINRVLDLLKPGFAEFGIKISRQYHESTIFILADASLIEGVFINLLKNATEALRNQHDGEISIHVRPDDYYYVIDISDNGPGIDQQSVEKIFVPFYTTKKNGSGIGLSISKKLVGLHEGSLRVYSIPGTKTTFQMRLKSYN